MKNLGSYKTNKLDNNKFRKISGDNNKVHYDENFCLKTHFGIPIVYAQLIVVKCLLKIKTKKIIKNLNLIESLYCKFDKPVFIKEKIYFKYTLKKNLILIKVSNQFELKSTIKLLLNKKKINNFKEQDYKFGSAKVKLDKKELMKIKFMFLLSNKIGNYKRRSNVISNYEIIFESEAKNNEKFYEVKKINLVQLEKTHLGLFAKAYFFSYKTELLQEKFSFKSNLLKNKNLNKKNFLVIGGSSGLGKIVTEFLSLKKKRITFTYNTGHVDAKKIYNNLKRKNKEIKYFKLNEKMINKK